MVWEDRRLTMDGRRKMDIRKTGYQAAGKQWLGHAIGGEQDIRDELSG